MPASNVRLIGISEVGHVTDPATDVPWGNTQQEGVTLQLSTQTVDLMSAQAKMKEHVSLLSASMQLVIALVGAELTAFQRAWGLPDSAFSGDLENATPTPEILTITESNLGSQERKLYVLGPGPASTRRIEATRCRVAALGNMQMSASGYTLPQATWEVLNPATGSPLVITDAV